MKQEMIELIILSVTIVSILGLSTLLLLKENK